MSTMTLEQARASMPKDAFGCVVSLEYLPINLVPRMEPLWREWCQATPKQHWPEWIHRWKDTKKLRGL
jgi:hypothetical protein